MLIIKIIFIYLFIYLFFCIININQINKREIIITKLVLWMEYNNKFVKIVLNFFFISFFNKYFVSNLIIIKIIINIKI